MIPSFKKAILPAALLAAAAAVVLLPRPAAPQEFSMPAQVHVTAPPEIDPLPDNVRPGLPEGGSRTMAVPTQRLLKGRMLLVSETDPLPDGYTPAAALSVLGYTGGWVNCRDLNAVSGQDTLNALRELFAAARAEGITQLTVFAGTRSHQQQLDLQTDLLASLARDMSLEDAARAARQAVASPGCSEHHMPWAVDVRVCPVWNGAPLAMAYEESPAGGWLAEHAWQFGFIRRWPDAAPDQGCRAWHLRYVGKAHAMLMQALRVTLEEYLSLLRRYQALTLYDQNNAPLACAVCVRAGEHQSSFVLPVSEPEDLSLDNQGWAVASCLVSGSAE